MDHMHLTGKEYQKYLREHFEVSQGEDMSLEELVYTVLSFSDCASKLDELMGALSYSFEPLSDCFKASYSELMQVNGMTHRTAVLIMLVGTVNTLRHSDKQTLTDVNYCDVFRGVLINTREESLWAAALDDEGYPISVERMSKGMRGTVAVGISRLAEYAASHHARNMVIAHSHPDLANSKESHSDELSASILGEKLNELGITLVGEVVISDKDSVFIPFKSHRAIRSRS